MSEQHSRFMNEFLATHVGYTNADFSFSTTTNTYSNPYINHCFQLFVSNEQEQQCVIEKELYYYVSFDESVVQELGRIHNSIDTFVDKMKEVCKVFNAKGFYPKHTYKTGFHFESFMFNESPDKSFWMKMNSGYLPSVPSLTKSLRILLNSKFKPVTYDNLLNGLQIKPMHIEDLLLIEDRVLVVLTKPSKNFDVLVPTTREYFEYISSSE